MWGGVLNLSSPDGLLILGRMAAGLVGMNNAETSPSPRAGVCAKQLALARLGPAR